MAIINNVAFVELLGASLNALFDNAYLGSNANFAVMDAPADDMGALYALREEAANGRNHSTEA